jgi:FAD-linked oxidoreductase
VRPGASTGWRNWTGDQRCRPAAIARPRTRDELAATIARAAEHGHAVKVPGSGHSFSDVTLTDGVMVRLDGLNRILDVDPVGGLVTVEAGMRLRELSAALHEHGRALANLGDIDRQTVAGAISTATHGTGGRLQNLSAQVAAVELVTAAGDVVALSADRDPDGFRAARVGLGALGALATVTLRTVPAFTLHRVDATQPLADVLDGFERLVDDNDHFEFFTFPYTGAAITVRRNRTHAPRRPRSKLALTVDARLVQPVIANALMAVGARRPALVPSLNRRFAPLVAEGEYVDDSHRVFTSERTLRFTEMEYAVPRAHGPEVVRRVLDWVHERRFPTNLPLECRAVAADDAFLSPSYERDTVYVAVHQYRGVEWRPYFDAVEAIAAEYGGRPHWGKRHGLTRETLASRYPRFDDFLAVRDRLDPGRVFANAYTRRCLGA